MKKVIKLEGLCCGNCASKIEAEVGRLKGVAQISLSFMTQRLTLEIQDDQVDMVMDAAKKIVKKIEPDVEFRIVR